jgi:outer membrane protein TolC
VAAASERVMDAQKSFLPSFSLTGNRGSASSDLTKLLNPDFLAASIAARIGQTIYDGGRIRGETEAARGRFEEAMANYRQNVLQAFGEVETALAAEDYLNRQLRSQKKAVIESIAAEDLAWDQYSRGLVESLTWLEAQRRSFNSRSALLQLQNFRLQNRINLHLALGGDFKTRFQK